MIEAVDQRVMFFVGVILGNSGEILSLILRVL
jgi:hypothetical protein